MWTDEVALHIDDQQGGLLRINRDGNLVLPANDGENLFMISHSFAPSQIGDCGTINGTEYRRLETERKKRKSRRLSLSSGFFFIILHSVFLSVLVTHYSLLGFGASKSALPLVLVLSFSLNLAKVVLDSERSAGNGAINGKRI